MKEIIKYQIDTFGSCEVRWARSGSVKEEETTRICSRYLIKDYIITKDHILGVDTWYKSSDWLETSQIP